MRGTELRDNPLAVAGAPPPRIHHVPANGTTLYAEERGAGPLILIIPGGGEDAEGWRPVAERLDGVRVITYDRRGTLRSGREDWPGRGASQHADDAAALLVALRATDAVVLGGSSGGVIAVELGLRHPRRVRRVLAYEPGYLRAVRAGAKAQRHALATVAAYLAAHPTDWVGAYDAFARAISPTPGGPADAGRGFLEPPPGLEWYARREERNAEPLMRDDIALITAGVVDEAALGASQIDIRFAYGTGSVILFREIATRLAFLRGARPDVVEGAGHALYLHPEVAAAWIAGCVHS